MKKNIWGLFAFLTLNNQLKKNIWGLFAFFFTTQWTSQTTKVQTETHQVIFNQTIG
jgi:hypothetical protein